MIPAADRTTLTLLDALAHHPGYAPDTWSAMLRDAHLRFGQALAVIHPTAEVQGRNDCGVIEQSLSYTSLLTCAGQVAAALSKLGVRRGDRVVLALDNRLDTVVLERALALWGITRVAISSRLHAREIEYIVENCQASMVICETYLAELLHVPCAIVCAEPSVTRPTMTIGDLMSCTDTPPAFPSITATDVMSIMYTSGTTGRPKGAMNSHRSWRAMASNLQAILPAIGPGDILLHAAPMSHFSGSVSSAYLVAGAAIATQRRFVTRDTVKLVRMMGVTCLPLVPTMLNDLVRTLGTDVSLRSMHSASPADNEAPPMPTLKAVPYGGSNISVSALQAARSAIGNRLIQMYGSSEALIPVTYLSIAEHAITQGETDGRGEEGKRLASAGIRSRDVEVRLGEPENAPSQLVDEICIRGDNVMLGYWNNQEETAKVLTLDGWYRSGDLGIADELGRIRIVDRKRDVIISGGFNVYPAEVERVIGTLPGVLEVAVIGVAHERWGEGVKALVVLKKGACTSTADIIEVCKSEMASYKKPLAIEFVEELPKTSTGKIDKRRIRDAQLAR